MKEKMKSIRRKPSKGVRKGKIPIPPKIPSKINKRLVNKMVLSWKKKKKKKKVNSLGETFFK